MLKKFMMALLGATMLCAALTANSVETKAALSCTYDIIYDANGNITNGKEMLAAAELNLAAADAYYKELAKSKTATQLELQQAKDAVANAQNVVRWWKDQVNNSNSYLGNIKAREKFEDDFINNRAALADLVTLQQAKADYDGAMEMVRGVQDRINEVDKALYDYNNQLSAHPEFKATIDELTNRRSTLKAEYDAKLVIANEKKAIYDNYAKTLNYASYDRSIEDYAHEREMNRKNPNWKK